MNFDDFDRLRRFIEQTQRDYAPILRAVRDHQRMFQTLADEARVVETATRIANQVSAFQAQLEPLALKLREAIGIDEERVHSAVLEKLRSRGWVALETQLSYWELAALAELSEDALDEHLCRLFRDDDHQRLAEMIDGWQEVAYLYERDELLTQCLSAHRQGLWAVVIPAVLPLLEGLSAEIAKTTIPGVNVKKNTIGKVILSYRAEDVPENSISDWTGIVVEFVERQVFRPSDFAGEPPPNPLNRHWILHGRVNHYWSETKTLQLWLLLHALAEVARAATKAALAPGS